MPSPLFSEVLFEEHPGEYGNLAVITLNRPAALNALTHAMCLAIYQQLHCWETDPHIKAVVIQGSGDKAFCAGGDIRSLYELGKQKSYNAAMPFFKDEYLLNYKIAHYKKPYIAFLDGITMGGGMGLSVHGHYKIGTERLLMAMPETGIGFFPDIGGSYFLSRCRNEIGTYLGLTGTRLNAADAKYAGLIDEVVSANHLPEILTQLINTSFEDDEAEVITHILQQFAANLEPSFLHYDEIYINECFNQNSIEAIFESLHSNPGLWHTTTLKRLSEKSPTSLKISLEALRRGINKDLAACLNMEYDLCYAFLQHPDFYEGVRALIIDKDKTPQWRPASIDLLSTDIIPTFFDKSHRQS